MPYPWRGSHHLQAHSTLLSSWTFVLLQQILSTETLVKLLAVFLLKQRMCPILLITCRLFDRQDPRTFKPSVLAGVIDKKVVGANLRLH
ncbi:hypothetical protein B0H11DRAFT_62015 [Mycena galericulata]|nr:hypothetical protein B0H11DRAFT_62015 [Mycena galericulata]